MEDLNDFITGDTLTAAQFIQPMSEVQNIIEDLGIALSAGDLNQLGKAIAGYVANGTFYTDSGIADAYVLSKIGSKQTATAYTDGFFATFKAGNVNAGASTVNVASLGVKNIKLPDGSDPVAGDIIGRMELVFDLANDRFELVNPKVTGRVVEFDTAAEMIADTSLSIGMKARTLGRKTKGDVGANTYLIVAAGTGTADLGSFIDLTGITGQAKGLFLDGEAHAEHFGVTTSGDQTTALTDFLTFFHDNKIKGVIKAGQYDISNILLTKTTSGKFTLVCQEGEAVFNYTGTEVNHIIRSLDCDHVLMINITFENNNLVNTALDLRKSSAFGGVAGLFNVNSNNVKETASAGSAIGLALSGSFAKVQFIGCDVNGSTYTTLGRDATGLVLSNFAGIYEFNDCNVKNITTPEDVNADGIKVFGDDVATVTTRLAAKGEIHNCVFQNCQDRFIKLQVSNTEIHGNLFLLDNNFSTITEWRGIDAQVGGCNIHHNNFVFGSGITWGTAANIVTFQNLRNDGTEQVSIFRDNAISCQTIGLPVIANLSARFGDNKFVICNNPVLGQAVKKGFAFRLQGVIGDTDSVSIEYCENTVEDYSGQDLFSLFDAIDYGDKLYLKIKNNRVNNITSTSRLTPGTPGFTIGANFTISNNVHTADQVQWTFDIDFLYGENDFVVGAQTIGGTTPGLGTTVYYSVQGEVQRAYNTGGTSESRRTKSGVNTWFAWVPV